MTSGATDVTTSTSWGAALKAGSVSATFTPTTGSPNTTGVLNVTAATDGAIIVMTGTYNGVERSVEIELGSLFDPPPAPGGSGSTSASDSTIDQTTSTSYGAANTGILTVRAGSVGQVACTFPAQFRRTTNGTSGALGKWQWRVVGGSFADITTEIASTVDADKAGGDEPYNTPGEISVAMTKTGLTNGTDYEFQLLLRADDTGTYNWTGTATATAT